MYIDSDLNNNTGLGGVDYIQSLEWNDTAKLWKVKLYETTDLNTNQRLIEERNYTQNEIKQTGPNGYIHLSLGLNLLNNPSEYRVIFLAKDVIINRATSKGMILFDVLNTVLIPKLLCCITRYH
jgi:hypothetical protein